MLKKEGDKKERVGRKGRVVKKGGKSLELESPLGVAAFEGRQSLHLLCALVLTTIVLCFVYLVFPVLDDRLPRGFLAEVLFVSPHKLRVPLLLLHLPVGQQTQNFAFLALLDLLNARD